MSLQLEGQNRILKPAFPGTSISIVSTLKSSAFPENILQDALLNISHRGNGNQARRP
jgi:hypothetical protein